MSHPTGSTSEYTRQELLRYHGFRLATYLERIEEVASQPYSPWEELLNALEWPDRCLRRDWDHGNILEVTQDLYKLNFALATFREACNMYPDTRDAESDSDAFKNLCDQAMDVLVSLIYETSVSATSVSETLGETSESVGKGAGAPGPEGEDVSAGVPAPGQGEKASPFSAARRQGAHVTPEKGPQFVIPQHGPSARSAPQDGESTGGRDPRPRRWYHKVSGGRERRLTQLEPGPTNGVHPSLPGTLLGEGDTLW